MHIVQPPQTFIDTKNILTSIDFNSFQVCSVVCYVRVVLFQRIQGAKGSEDEKNTQR